MAGWWSRQSIERRIPAVFVALLAVMGGVHMAVAYRGFEQSASEAARERLANVGSQLALLAAASSQQRAATLRRAVNAPQFSPILEGSADPDSILDAITGSGIGSQRAVVIVDRELEIIAHAGRELPPATMAPLARVAGGALEVPGHLRVGRLFELDGGAHFWSGLSAQRADGSQIVLVQLSRVGEGEAAPAGALEALIGETVVLVANVDATGPWVHLDGALDSAPDSVQADRYHRAGEEYFFTAAAVPGTPWRIIAETPRDLVQGRALAFIRGTLPLGFLVLLIGGVAAWLIGRHYTRPLYDFMTAAADIAGGDLTRRVHTSGGAEYLAFASSFNHMAAELERNHAQLEDRVRQRTAELEAVNAELQAFSYSVSHDLRSPLRSIDGFSQALLEDYAPALDATAQDYIQRVRGGAQRMGQLIDDLLQLSRVTRQPLVRTEVDITEIAEQVVAELRQAEPARDVAVHIQPGLTAAGDRGLLQVALRNLIENAWKFSGRVDHPRIDVGRDPEDGSFFVRDNGAGFSMEYAHQLFTPFHRLHTVRDFPGTGIGLATVQRVISRHGGRVRVSAEIDRGAEFHFTLGSMTDADEYDTAG